MASSVRSTSSPTALRLRPREENGNLHPGLYILYSCGPGLELPFSLFQRGGEPVLVLELRSETKDGSPTLLKRQSGTRVAPVNRSQTVSLSCAPGIFDARVAPGATGQRLFLYKETGFLTKDMNGLFFLLLAIHSFV